MTLPLIEYFQALDRLKSDCPVRVPKGTKITNDSVALEAGRGKGSIKKSRPVFASLIQAIDEAAIEPVKNPDQQKKRLEKIKEIANQYHRELEAALVREVSLLYELYEIKKQMAQLTGANVLPLRPIKD